MPTIETISVLLYNHEDKLSQAKWSQLCLRVATFITMRASNVHFSGHSDPNAPEQTAFWMFQVPENEWTALLAEIKVIVGVFELENFSLTFGSTTSQNSAPPTKER